MRRYWSLLSFPCLAALLLMSGGCVSQDMAYLRRDINTLQRQIDDLQQEIRSTRTPTAPQQTVPVEVRKGEADVEAELQTIQTSLQTLGARIEDNQQFTTKLASRLDELETRLTARLEDLEARIVQPKSPSEEALAKPSQAVPPPAGEEAPLQPEKQELATIETPTPGVSPDVERIYQEAYQTFQAGNLDQARDKFAAFLKLYPETPLSDNAQFWIGEIAFKNRQYEAAILAYEDVIKKYPDSNKVPDATLKQGLAFLELGDKIDARIVLENLVKKYPNTEQAQIAKAKLKTIK